MAACDSTSRRGTQADAPQQVSQTIVRFLGHAPTRSPTVVALRLHLT